MTEQRKAVSASARAATAFAPKDGAAKIALTLRRQHVEFLDAARTRMRRRSAQPMPRGYVVRGLVELMERSGIDFSLCPSSTVLTTYLGACLGTLAGENRSR